MAAKRIENSKERLQDKINESKNYLKEESYDTNELVRLLRHLEKKKAQFEKDFAEYEKMDDKDEDKINELESIKFEAEDTTEDIEHYLNVTKEQLQQREHERQIERETEERRLQNEAEEKRQQFELQKYEIEMERRKQEQEHQYELERLRIQSEVEKEKYKTESTVAEREKKIATKIQTVRLPKLELKKFNGQLLKWQTFWDTFEATIHNNESLHKIDKFNYLKSQLEGDALKSVAGLELTQANYDVAIETLKERYGNVQLIIENHYAKLSDLNTASNKTNVLRSTYDTIEQHLRSLEALGEDIDHKHYITTIKRKFPISVIAHIEQQKNFGEEWTVTKLRKALQKYITAKEIAEHHQPSTHFQNKHQDDFKRPNHTPQTLSSPGTTGAMLTNARNRNPSCIFCGKRHWSDECRTVSSLTERKEKLKGKCYICLQERHKGKCKVEKSCYHCKKTNHHRSLCPTLFEHQQSYNSNGSMMITNDTEEKESSIEEEGLLSAGENVIMQTALVEAMDKEELSSETTRVLMDTGSSRTYVTNDLVKKLKLEIEDSNKLTIYTFAVSKPKEITSPVVTIVLKSKDGNTVTVKANVVPKISGQINRHPVNLKDKLKFQRTFKLADTLPTNRESATIGVLIGNDYYNEVMTGETRRIQEGLFALKSKFGWMISGRTKTLNDNDIDNNFFVMTQSSTNILPEIQHFTKKDDSLQTPPNLEEFWKLETIGITQPEIAEDDSVMEHFYDTVQKKDGRYEVEWPWRQKTKDLPENYELCIGRLKSLHKRLTDNPDVLQKYDAIITDQLQKGVIERVYEETEQGDKLHYIPHHAVFTPDSNTTKVRIVYDASAKTKKSNLSLNECLHRGPVILEDLCGLLMRFRTKKIGIIADIEKAFFQVGLQPRERDVTRFLWLKNVNAPPTPENLVIYRFTRVPFGIISSPFLLGATIKHHLRDKNEEHIDISRDMYVDNLITGADNKVEAKELYLHSKKKFAEISMNLREWKSNSTDVNDQFDQADKMKGDVTKVLGLQWNTQSDKLSISTNKFSTTTPANTKREILAAIASIYDPLGMMTPKLIKLKIFLQELWKKEMEWDDPLDESDKEKWLALTKDLSELSTIQVPRFVGNEKAQLIGFCDASKNAYATAIYLRTEIEGKVNVNLIFSKARNAPKDKGKTEKKNDNIPNNKTTHTKLTIPRLELMSTLIGTRSLRFIAKELGLEGKQMTLWTDSQCVLDWLKQKESNVFVKNRVKEIISKNDINFRYINTKHNPADIPTRGMSTEELKKSNLWWHGPEWLKADTNQWPTWDVKEINKDIIEEMLEPDIKPLEILYETSVPTITTNNDSNQSLIPPFGINLDKYCSITKVLRITAYANRFLSKTRSKSEANGDLNAGEIETAKMLWIKYLQKKRYLTENNGKTVLNKQTAKSQLNPRLDPDSIIRCYSRLTNADLPQETITPILLPRGERFVQLMIEDIHKKLFHTGVNHTLSQMRKMYWIPQGRAEIKYVLRRCRICRKHQGGPYKMPPMSPWPRSKLSRSIPFEKTGLDYFGPLYVKQGVGQSTKVWVCLFTCVVVRAIHLEIVNNLTAEEFIMALRRFIARRGKPNQIISDNASQFKLSKSIIDAAWTNVINDPAVTSYTANEGIHWTFIIELSPWMGGFYERLVGSSKMALKKAIGKKHLTHLQLQTYLTETEAILNSRPLVYVSEDLNDGITITPSHFITPNSKTGDLVLDNQEEMNDEDYVDGKKGSKEVLLDTWKKGQRLLETFWNIWRDNYLLSLRERSRSHLLSPRVQAEEEPKVGDIVQLKESTPRGSWKLGRIVKLITSSDGNIRAAKVMLATRNIVNRPLNLLYPLECEKEYVTFQKTANFEKEDRSNKNTENIKDDCQDNDNRNVRRSTRRAAFEARDRIFGQNLDVE